jgi:hypothetical protein
MRASATAQGTVSPFWPRVSTPDRLALLGFLTTKAMAEDRDFAWLLSFRDISHMFHSFLVTIDYIPFKVHIDIFIEVYNI